MKETRWNPSSPFRNHMIYMRLSIPVLLPALIPTLLHAFKTGADITEKALIISARLVHETRGQDLKPFGDGFITNKGTFQKYYNQNELRNWIDQELNVSSVAASPGIFIVFRDETLLQNYLASLTRQKFTTPPIRNSELIYEKNKELLDALAEFILERGRPPDEDEFSQFPNILEKFGSIKRAFAVIKKVTNPDQWGAIFSKRSEELLINFALQRLNTNGRPKFSKLPKAIQLDVKSFFGNYTYACSRADELLFSAGKIEEIDKACRKSRYGKLTQDSLYIHISALETLPNILRVYDGCARKYVGIVEGANIIKLHRFKPKVSYLSYPAFEKDPHPRITGALVVPLQDFNVKYWDWESSDNPPILHKKEDFVSDDYKDKEKFRSLTMQEEKAGLYDHPSIIGRVKQWNQVLLEKGKRLSGHRLVNIKVPETGK